ncbi:MAG: hypothetical protein ACI9TH_005071 [Kiritimatiellia bacterium]
MLKNDIMIKCILMGCATMSFAGPGDGIRFDKLTLHPFVEGSVNYDSNVGLTQRSELEAATIDQNEESETYMQLRYGLEFEYQRDMRKLSGTAYGYNRYYQDFDLDNSGLGQNLSFSGGTPERLAFTITEGYFRVQDYSTQPLDAGGPSGNLLAEDRTDRIKRDLLNVGLNLKRQLSAKLGLGGGYAYSMTDYDDARAFDADTQTYSADLSWDTTAKTAAFVTGSLGLEDSDALDQHDGESTSALVGVRSTATEKISYNLGVGYIGYKVDGLEGVDIDGLNYALGLGWKISAKTSLNASANKSFSASSFAQNNAREVQMAQVGLSYRATDALGLGLAFSVRQDDFVNPVIVPEGPVDESRTTQAINFTANYAPPGRWYRLFGSAGYEDSTSEIIGEDYEQVRVSAGVNLVY